MHSTRRHVLSSLASTLVVTLAGLNAAPALAQTYPTKPVKILIGFAAGGPTDVIARVLAQDMTA